MITIVTINLNNKDGLKRTIESVVNQTFFDKVEYVIIDGGSTDGSVDVIKEYDDNIAYWCSEPDGGIFPAMNKSIEHINGDYVLYLNSGDILNKNNVIERVYGELDKDIVYGNEYKVNNKKTLARFPDKLTEAFFKRSALPHQSTFIRTELLKEHNYSTDWKVLGDWSWLRERIMVDKVSYKHLNFPISDYDLNGFSTINQKLFFAERDKYYKQSI
ncbi:glycosyltransferase family 2 protein [Methanobrevibacter sp.]|uniref:glycosyltransferase family 2 protein n=1 Tax=Methanobrevibacter sp. TaxID=66852 RepID=UPI00386FBB25